MAGKSVDGVAKLNADEDVRLERRPATLDEFRRLLVAASCGLPFRGLTGTDRVMLYLVASETGLRANELASLTVASLDLDARIPAITVEAASSKRRRRDVQPIRSELAARLRTWLSQRERTAASLRLRDNTADESAPSENDRESSSSPNEKTPVWQGFEDDCGLVMLPENQEPPVRLELTTYALRKHRSTN